jgi:hypothetical protein
MLDLNGYAIGMKFVAVCDRFDDLLIHLLMGKRQTFTRSSRDLDAIAREGSCHSLA